LYLVFDIFEYKLFLVCCVAISCFA